jgi:hypothetical protein
MPFSFPMSPSVARAMATAGAFGLALLLSAPANAQSIIKHPGDHPNYSFEAEPHLAVDPFGDEAGIGPGFRGTLVLMDNGFIPSLNNSIGLGFGLDWIFYGDHCHGGADNRQCDARGVAMIPIVMQWNFWLHPKWSVFGEPGMRLLVRNGGNAKNFDVDVFTFYAGGRFHFNDEVALTMRLAAPFFYDNVFSIGVSFLL